MGENIVKITKGAKVKVLLQGLLVTHGIPILVLSLFFIHSLPLCIYVNSFLLHLDHISFILCTHAFYHIKMNNFCKSHILNIHNF
jgi:hypothetical protein